MFEQLEVVPENGVEGIDRIACWKVASIEARRKTVTVRRRRRLRTEEMNILGGHGREREREFDQDRGSEIEREPLT